MLNYARTLVGKPFSNSGMARSVFFPRTSDGKSFFCAGTCAYHLPASPSQPRPPSLALRRAFVRRARGVCAQEGWTHVRVFTHFPLRTHISQLCRSAHGWVCVCVCVMLFRSLDSNPGAATPKGLHRMYKDQAAATANPYTLRQFSKHDNMSGVVKDEGIRLMGIGPNSKSSYADGYKSGVTTSNKNRPRSRNDPPPRTSFRCVNGSDSLNSHKNNTSVFVKW